MPITTRAATVALVLMTLCGAALAQQERIQLVEPRSTDQKERPSAECRKPSGESAPAWYGAGICFYEQARAANALAYQANRRLIDFVNECNRNVSCDSDSNKPVIDKLSSETTALIADVRVKLSNSVEALTKGVAINGEGAEAAEARRLLELMNKVLSWEGLLPVGPDEVSAPIMPIMLRHGE
jgi:hypothetical protein